MRLDHIAFRVADRKATAAFFQEAFGYKVQAEFQIDFPDGTKAECIALEPAEKNPLTNFANPWTAYIGFSRPDLQKPMCSIPQFHQEYHMPPELFVSDGPPGSIVGEWVARRNGVGGIHHMAWQVDSVEKTMKLWQEKGWAQFTSDKPMTCPGLTQVFTKPLAICGGVIHEFIERGEHGFCAANVQELMESTKGL